MASRGKSQTLARRRIMKARGNICEKCGYQGYVELHHIVTFSDGGGHNDDNVLLLCDTCHRKSHGIKPRKPDVAMWATR